jgi:DNA-binding NtrC family response regulator
LVVDDNASVRLVLDCVLTGAGYRVRPAPDGPAALALARAELPDLVVLDLQMPGMDGEEVLHALRQLDPRIPIFFLTACGDFPGRPVLHEADCCFVKSSDLTPMLDAIAYACGGEDPGPRCRSRPGLAENGTCLP